MPLREPISIHAPMPAICGGTNNFNPRTPCGVRLANVLNFFGQLFISIHAPHAGCDDGEHPADDRQGISIHAPHAGCDADFVCGEPPTIISIHAPHAGCDMRYLCRLELTGLFQSTHPMRGATARAKAPRSSGGIDFNPRTPCGVRHIRLMSLSSDVNISIHAPHAGCDPAVHHATDPEQPISIHAPHAGCDLLVGVLALHGRISIHAPHAGCDQYRVTLQDLDSISIHAPHAGCDTSLRS